LLIVRIQRTTRKRGLAVVDFALLYRRRGP
jgi:hypothetical protein